LKIGTRLRAKITQTAKGGSFNLTALTRDNFVK
jgi:hypothetical protein